MASSIIVSRPGFFAGDAGEHVVDGREAHDLAARDPPRLLHDPGQRPILAVRLDLDLVQHVLGEVQGLLALVGSRHRRSVL
jgi:hypothetical protein